jgi:hypothetical protein
MSERASIGSLSLDDLAGDFGVLVEGVDSAQAVVAVGDGHLAVRRVADEEQRGELSAALGDRAS